MFHVKTINLLNSVQIKRDKKIYFKNLHSSESYLV